MRNKTVNYMVSSLSMERTSMKLFCHITRASAAWQAGDEVGLKTNLQTPLSNTLCAIRAEMEVLVLRAVWCVRQIQSRPEVSTHKVPLRKIDRE